MFIVQAPGGFSIAAGVFLLACGCAHASAVVFGSKDSALTVRHPALYPETIEYESGKDRFLLGSFRDGGIYAVDQEGRTSRLVDDPRLCSVLGIAIAAEPGVGRQFGSRRKPQAVRRGAEKACRHRHL
jgi:hypothetical protein